MDQGTVIHKFQKNSEEEIRMTLREYKERRYLDLRLWFQPSNGGDYRPSKKGITFAVEHLDEFKKGLDRVEKAVLKMPLQPPSNSLK